MVKQILHRSSWPFRFFPLVYSLNIIMFRKQNAIYTKYVQPILSVFSGAQPNTSAIVARTNGPTVGTALPNHAKIIREVITAKIGTSIASIVLRVESNASYTQYLNRIQSN